MFAIYLNLLLLTDGTVLPLSQKRSAQFRQLLTRYLAQQL